MLVTTARKAAAIAVWKSTQIEANDAESQLKLSKKKILFLPMLLLLLLLFLCCATTAIIITSHYTIIIQCFGKIAYLKTFYFGTHLFGDYTK